MGGGGKLLEPLANIVPFGFSGAVVNIGTAKLENHNVVAFVLKYLEHA